MYTVIDKSKKGIISDSDIVHVNPAPLHQGLTDKEVYADIKKSHKVVKSPHKIVGLYLDGDVLRLPTLQERADAGLIVVPEGQVIDGDKIRDMTDDEKLSAGLLTKKEYDAIKVEELINNKIREMVQAEADRRRLDAIQALKDEGKLDVKGELK